MALNVASRSLTRWLPSVLWPASSILPRPKASPIQSAVQRSSMPDPSNSSGEAVSYTHLAVYKRQRYVLFGNERLDLTFSTQRQTVGQIFLDRHKATLRIGGEIDNRKTTQRELVFDAVFIELVSGRKSVVCLLRHRYRSYHVVFQHFRALPLDCKANRWPATQYFAGLP